MAIICYSGLPGTGKTASATHYAVKKYKRDNRKLVLLIRHFRNSEIQIKDKFKLKVLSKYYLDQYKVNLLYSNYPILLDKKNRVFSNVVKPNDLTMIYQFPKRSSIIIDETQRYYDSREFKKFPKEIGVFFQHHRHADIIDIILVTQHPRRLDNKMRDLAEVFRKYRMFVKIPLLPLIFCTYTNYYEFEEYGKFNHVKKEMRSYDYDNHIRIMLTDKIFSRYESKYFKVIFEQLTNIVSRPFISKDLSFDDIKAIGIEM